MITFNSRQSTLGNVKNLFPSLSPSFQETDNRYVVFNNKEVDMDKDREQVWTLLLTVRGLLHAVDDTHFSNPFLVRCQETVMTNASQLADMLGGPHTRYGLVYCAHLH